MNPVMFCRNNSGILRRSQSSMKCAPLSADSANRTPLLAMIPTGWPCSRANPVTSVGPYSGLNSANRLAATHRGNHPPGAQGGRDGGRRLGVVPRLLDRLDVPGARLPRAQGADDLADDPQRVGVVLGEVV